MAKPLATLTQMVQGKLVNHIPVHCPVCDHYVSSRAGLAVILNDQEQIIEFVHSGCCKKRKDVIHGTQ